MVRKSLLILSVLLVAIFFGCNKTEMGNSNTASENSNKSMTSTTNTSGTTASTGGKIGIAECDDFITKYEACVSGKVPEVARAQYQNMLKQWRESWKKAAENPQTKAALATQCKQIKEQQEAALKNFGCAL